MILQVLLRIYYFTINHHNISFLKFFIVVLNYNMSDIIKRVPYESIEKIVRTRCFTPKQ